MPQERVIYHIDCNSFFASVESIERPELCRVPMAVSGDPKERHGIILAKNELAKRYGIKTAETVHQALRKCPELVLVAPHYERYQAVSQQVKRLFGDYTDQVESFGLDEAWLDVTGSLRYFRASPVELADRIRERVKREIGVTVSVGVSYNKVFAKLGSDLKKPDATTLITRQNYQRRVWPLPAEALLFVGRTASAALHRRYIHTIGDIAHCEPEFLERLLGKGGETLWRYANGLDDSPVRRIGEEEPLKSIGNGKTFRRDLLGWAELKCGVLLLTDEIAARLRDCGMKCTSVQITVKNTGLKSITRQKQLAVPTHLQKELTDTAMELLKCHWRENVPVRALTVTAQNLTSEPQTQVGLMETQRRKLERFEQAEAAMRELRRRYGHDSLSMGCAQHEMTRMEEHREAAEE